MGGGRYSAYHHSHPTLTERLRALDGYKSAAAKAKDEAEKKWKSKEKRVKKKVKEAQEAKEAMVGTSTTWTGE